MANAAVEIIVRAIDQASATIKGIGASGAGMSKEMESACIKAGAALTGIGIAAKLAADDINNSFLSFEKSVASVHSLGATTAEEIDLIQTKSIELSKVLPMSAEEIANGFYQMISAGYDAGEAIASMDTIAKMAVGGQMEMADAVNATTMVLDVYGDKAGSTEHVTDVLMGTVAAFKTTLPQLQQELSKCIAPANTLGISFEEVSAMAGMLKKDFVSAEEAGTSLKTMFVRLSDENVIKYLGELGVNVADANGNFVGMESVLTQLDAALQASGGNLDRNGTLIKIFGTEGYRAADSLLRQKDEMGGYVQALEDGGQATEAFNAMMDTTGAKLDIATNKMDAAKIALGGAMVPATLLAADAMSTFAGIIENLPDGIQTMIGMFLTFGQALIPIGPLLMILPTIIGVIAPIFAAGAISVAGMTIALGPLALAIAGIIAAVILLKAAWDTNFMGIRDVVGAAKEYITDRFEGIKAAFAPVKDALAEGFGKIKEAAGQLFGKMDELFQKLTGGISIVDAAKAAFDLLGRIIDAVWKIIGEQLVKAIDIAVDGLSRLIDFVGRVVDWFIKLADNPIVQWFIKLADGAAKVGRSLLDNILPAAQKTGAALDDNAKTVESVADTYDEFGNVVPAAMKAAESGVSSSAAGMNSALASTANAAVQAANTIASAMAQSMGLSGSAATGYSSKSGNYTDPTDKGGGPGMYGLSPGTYYMGPAGNPSAMLEINEYGYQYSTRDDRYKGQGQEYGWAGKQAGGGSSPAAWMKLPAIAEMFGLSTSGTAPRLARGGNITSPGKVIVGEEGPELLSLPRDAQVSPLSGSSGGPQIHIHIQNLLGVPDRNALRPVARIIKNLLTEEDNRRGAAI